MTTTIESGIESTTDAMALEPEIILDDSFAEEVMQKMIHEGVVSEAAPIMQASLLRNQSAYNLPAALCDETLLEELNTIPDKMGFKIGDVADMLGIKQYVLRYWETEFDVLRPKKASNNQRYYTKRDVENAYLIRKLLHRDRFSIEGARSAMKELKAHIRKEKDWSQVNQRIDGVHERLEDLALEIRKMRSLFR